MYYFIVEVCDGGGKVLFVFVNIIFFDLNDNVFIFMYLKYEFGIIENLKLILGLDNILVYVSFMVSWLMLVKDFKIFYLKSKFIKIF